MKKLLLVLSVSALTLVSCSKESRPCNCTITVWEEGGGDPDAFDHPFLDTLLYIIEDECRDSDEFELYEGLQTSISCDNRLLN